jgi:hypothetical protein
MGTEYYFVNKENKTFYDLGKGGWYVLADELEAVTYPEYLAHIIYHDVFCFSNLEQQDPKDFEFCNNLAKELIGFVNGADPKNLIIVNDCGDDATVFKGLQYRCVGSRYNNSEDLDNKHLKDRKYLYNLERMINSNICVAIGNEYLPINESSVASNIIRLIEKYGGLVKEVTLLIDRPNPPTTKIVILP